MAVEEQSAKARESDFAQAPSKLRDVLVISELYQQLLIYIAPNAGSLTALLTTLKDRTPT